MTKLVNFKVLSLLLLLVFAAAAPGLAQKGANRGGGGGGTGGGGSPTPTPTPVPSPTPSNPLPQTPPAPDVIYRESFGEGPELLRPTGSRGVLRETYVHTPINNFWIEYPGSPSTGWIAPAEGQTWRLCGASTNPFEMFSPLQLVFGNYNNGCVASEWTNQPTQSPTALMPFTAPAVPYEISFNGYPAPIAGKYLALGLTNSAATEGNLANSGKVVLVLKPAPPYTNTTILYELRVGGMNGALLAAGETYFEGWNQMKVRYDPVGKIVGASVNGTELGNFPLDLGAAAPRYVGFEGVGIGDNLVIRKLQ